MLTMMCDVMGGGGGGAGIVALRRSLELQRSSSDDGSWPARPQTRSASGHDSEEDEDGSLDTNDLYGDDHHMMHGGHRQLMAGMVGHHDGMYGARADNPLLDATPSSSRAVLPPRGLFGGLLPSSHHQMPMRDQGTGTDDALMRTLIAASAASGGFDQSRSSVYGGDAGGHHPLLPPVNSTRVMEACGTLVMLCMGDKRQQQQQSSSSSSSSAPIPSAPASAPAAQR